jgi:hypothetical protein
MGRVENELMLKACGEDTYSNLTAEETIALKEAQAKKGQNVGTILEGSANLVNALGGLYGTYIASKTGGYVGTGTGGFGNTPPPTPEESEEAKAKRTRNAWIIGGVSVVIIGVIVIFAIKNKDNN